MIHFLGSDVHIPQTIYTKMLEILQELGKVIDEDKIEELTSINPGLVLENKPVYTETPTKIKKLHLDRAKTALP